MSLKEFEKLTAEELKTREEELRREVYDLRNESGEKKKNSSVKLRGMRKDIARIQTLSRQRELAAQS